MAGINHRLRALNIIYLDFSQSMCMDCSSTEFKRCLINKIYSIYVNKSVKLLLSPLKYAFDATIMDSPPMG